MKDPTQRFSDRVDHYIGTRPHYPRALVEVLRKECTLAPAAVIADLGCGTGFLAELFVENGNPVFGVEPNENMRRAAERLFEGKPNFRSVEGTAEATTLHGASTDFVTAGQAFHWFDRGRSRTEMARILKPGGWVVLVWNDRKKGASRFLEAYEEFLLAFGTDYREVDHRKITRDDLAAFYGAAGFRKWSADQEQRLDREGLRGRVLSSSFMPGEDDPAAGPMLAALGGLFDRYQTGGRVTFVYETRMYFGHLT